MIGAADLAALLIALQIKHLLADYVWQTRWMLANKRRYGHPGGLAHAGLHAAMTVPILAWLSLPVLLLTAIAVSEAVLHYHIDFLKEFALHRRRWNVADRNYWILAGADQAAHQVTYAAMVALAVGAG